jgi:hypothetical protein
MQQIKIACGVNEFLDEKTEGQKSCDTGPLKRRYQEI